jgi:hypothetical protein
VSHMDTLRTKLTSQALSKGSHRKLTRSKRAAKGRAFDRRGGTGDNKRRWVLRTAYRVKQ